MLQYFLLTYSVYAPYKIQEDIDKANRVRDSIAETHHWNKLKSVETTFSGVMDISGDNQSSMRKSAIKNVKDVFLPILEKHNVKINDVKISCAIMVEDVGEAYEFIVENNYS